MSKIQNPERGPERLTFNCECGITLTVIARHYDIIRCERCHRSYWTIRRLKVGPLSMIPYPDKMPRESKPLDKS